MGRWHAMNWLRSRLSGPARRRVRAVTDPFAGVLGSIRAVRTTEPLVGLTFDDGPDPVHTPAVLDALAAHGAKATWFVLVDRAEAHPELLERIVADGHEVGLHGMDHRRLTRLSRQEVRRHVQQGVARLTALTGEKPRYFRPPYGSQSVSTLLAVRLQGMQSVVWAADCDDWSPHPETFIAGLAMQRTSRGSLLLLHDSSAADPEDIAPDPHLDRGQLVELILSGLAARGLESVTLSELLAKGKPHHTMWFRP